MGKKLNGEGTIFRRKTGSWVGQLMDGYKENGKKNIVCFSAPTKGEVRMKMAAYWDSKEADSEADPEAEESNADAETRFSDWANLWYEDHKTEVQPSTYSNYQYTLNTLIKHFGERPLGRIKQIDINRFLDGLASEGSSKSKISKCKAMLIQIFNAAEANELIARNPALHAKGARRQQGLEDSDDAKKDAFSEAEVNSLIDNLQDTLLGNSILLMIGTGMRTQELLALTRDDIAEDGSSVRINKAIEMVDGHPQLGPPKSKRSRRTIPVPPDYRFFARRLRALGGTEHLWESMREDKLYSVGTFRKKYYAALKSISGVRQLSPHCCRHTYITRLQEKGVSMELVARLAGHSRIGTTDGYTHTSIDILAGAVNVLTINKKED